ncbi:MAG TPA: NAD-dependent epimerase/dehydratase family protein [Armatimonadota bacterium]|nr:NAD-dependent epimerase/dehydratase family protein [Armatimonadota bacterium]
MRKGYQRLLVTGAAGFMGSHLVDALVAEGHAVFGVDDMSGGYWRNINPRSEFTVLDLRDRQATAAYIEKIRPEIIFHMAADATEGRSQFTPITSTERNYLAYLNVLVPAIRTGMQKMVLISSMSVYGAQPAPFEESMPRLPEDIYAISKAAMEHATEILSQVHGFRYTIIRPHNVYGERQNIADPYRNVIGIFINRLLQEKSFYIYGDGNQTRAFSHVDDFTPYTVRAGFDAAADGEIFNIGPREEFSINETAHLVLKHFGYDPDNPPEAVRPVYQPPRPKEVREAYCTLDKAQRILGYHTSVSLDEGIRRMVTWAKELGPQPMRYLEDGLELTSGNAPKTWTRQLM